MAPKVWPGVEDVGKQASPHRHQATVTAMVGVGKQAPPDRQPATATKWEE